MDLRQLEHFVAAAEEQHFTRAARRVHIVQSALSASIRSLEAELGAELFQRSARRVTLTAAGQALLEKARLVLAAAREARESVAAVQGLERGTLTIGTVHSLGAFIDLPELLDRFHGTHPAIEIRLLQDSSTVLIEKIRDGRVDLAFTQMFEPPPDIATRMIACEALVVACSRSHPLADAVGVPLRRLEREPFVDFQSDWGTRRLIDDVFAHAGVKRHTAFEVTDLETQLDLVARGLGIALVPEPIATARAAHPHARPVALAHLEEPEVCWELVVAFASTGPDEPEPRNAAAGAFLGTLAEVREM